jgi:hypothetical protein
MAHAHYIDGRPMVKGNRQNSVEKCDRPFNANDEAADDNVQSGKISRSGASGADSPAA